MIAPALIGTYPHPGLPNATLTAGWPHTVDRLTSWFQRGPVNLACDIETYGIGADAGLGRIKCVTFATGRDAVVLDPRDQHDHHWIARTIEYAGLLIMHKVNFDAPSLAVNGLLRYEHVDKIVDTLVHARIATPGDTVPKTLDALILRYLGIESGKITDTFKALGYKNKTEGFLKLDIDAPVYLMGAAGDAIATARVLPLVYQAAIDQQVLGHPFDRVRLSREEAAEMLENQQIKNRWAIERTIDGLAINIDYLTDYRNRTGRTRDHGEAALRQLGIDPGNGNHLTAYLEKEGVLPSDHRRTKTGKLGATENDLERLAHPVARTFLDVKASTKLDGYLAKCVDLADSSGRIHPVTDIAKAVHGRDSMADPPLHQFPEDARPIIVADEGTTWTSVDWSQQEPRIAMNLAGDVRPLGPYENHGVKIYQGIADFAQISMDQAKIVVLAGLYGEGMKLLSSSLGLPPDPWIPAYETHYGKVIRAHWGYQAARDIRAATFSAIPETEKFMYLTKNIARDLGKVWTVNGRILNVPMGTYVDEDGNEITGRQSHKGINFTVCGSAADELTNTIVWGRKQGIGQLMKFHLHDELVVDTRVAPMVQRQMETPSERFCMLAGRVPVIRTDSAFMGRSWRKV